MSKVLWIKPHSEAPSALEATEETLRTLIHGGQFHRKDGELVRSRLPTKGEKYHLAIIDDDLTKKGEQ